MNMSSWWEKGMVDVKDGAFRAALSFASLTPWISSPHMQWQCHCAGRATFHFTSTQLPLFLLAFLASLSRAFRSSCTICYCTVVHNKVTEM
jgi:hypothetical protein